MSHLSYEQIENILSERGYQRVKSPVPEWRSWFWVAPLSEDAIPTKLCHTFWGLSEEGLHFLLDHYCELLGGYWTDRDRARNAARASQ